jgi:hypothetical protein
MYLLVYVRVVKTVPLHAIEALGGEDVLLNLEFVTRWGEWSKSCPGRVLLAVTIGYDIRIFLTNPIQLAVHNHPLISLLLNNFISLSSVFK